MKTRIAVFLALAFASIAGAAEKSHWVATWGASPAPQLATEAEIRTEKLQFENQTLREIVHTSIGSNMVRVRLSNAYGKQTVDIGAAHIALRAKGSEITAGTDRILAFGGRPSVSIPPNALVLSDPVKLDVPASGDLAISIFLPKATNGPGIHYAAQQTSYIGAGDQTGAASINESSTHHVQDLSHRR